jgi:sigma-B regulation protein RsbU (phosphoserine phosphatase)
VDIGRLRSSLAPLAASLGARCVFLGSDGRTLFDLDPSRAPCAAALGEPRTSCPAAACPFNGTPFTAPVQEAGVTVGRLFFCVGDEHPEPRGLTAGLAHLVATIVHDSDADKLRSELQIARRMQEALLPASVPEVEGLALAAVLNPANNVGGDYYDVVPLGGGYVGVVIADVAGHGVSSGMMMTSFRMALLTELSREFSPAVALRRVNTLLHRDCDRSRMFVSAVLAVYEPLTGNVQYANAGHNPPRLRKPGRPDVVRLGATGLPIGMFEDGGYDEASVILEPGDALVLYTDGLVENRNAAGVALGETGLDDLLSAADAKTAEDLLRFVLASSERHLGGVEPRDDVTVVVATRTF